MANGTIHKIGTLYVNNIKRPLPTKPWRTDAVPAGATVAGDLLNYASIGGVIDIKDTDSNDACKIRWVEVNDGTKTLLISDRCLLGYVSWSQISNLITGKEITIDGKNYLLRVLTGGTTFRTGSDSYSGGTPTTNEWDRIICNEGGFAGLPTPTASDLDTTQNATDFSSVHNTLWNWSGEYSWCQETNASTNSARTARGYGSARVYQSFNYDSYMYYFGWRPVLEVINVKPVFSIGNSDLGEIVNFTPLQYSVSDINDDNFTITEKLDGDVIRTLTNQASGTSYTLDLTSTWDSLGYGEHTLDIIVDDGKELGINTLTITFEKVKEHTLPIESASLIELIDHFDNVVKDVDYERTRLAQKLISKQMEVSETDKISILIDKVDSIEVERHHLPKWYTISNFWGKGKNMIATRTLAGSGMVDGKIYVIGGNRSGVSDANECYDTLTDTWTVKAVMPTKRDGLVCNTVGSKIYVIGGAYYVDASVYVLGTNECYDTLTNTWTTKTTMLSSRAFSASAVVGDNIYIIGGGGTNYSVSNNECYNTVTNTWSAKAIIRSVRKHTASTVGDNIYTFGGTNDGYKYGYTDCYNTITNTWSTKAGIAPRYGLTSNAIGSGIYIMGGNDQYTLMQVYDTITNTFSTKPTMPIALENAYSQVVDKNIHIIGGGDGSGNPLLNQFYVI